VDVGNLDGAVADYNAVELNRFYAAAYNSRGYTYLQKGEQDKAIDDFTKAI
jgi:tetratricopeptide (TPR) repeat protein